MTNPITTLSRKRLEQLSSYEYVGSVLGHEIGDMARDLLAVMDAKPYGYVAESPCSSGYGGIMHEFSIERLDAEHDANEHDGFVIELYTTPPAPSAPDGWIKCSDRMPDFEKYVLVTNGKHTGVGAYMRDEHLEDDERWQDEHFEFINLQSKYSVTHWMPLPAAPGAEQ